MKLKTFRGGIHPNTAKQATRDQAVRDVVVNQVCIPMSMHLGAESEPCVSVGDHVLLGQVIGTPVGALGLPVHASVSGDVVSIQPRMLLGGKQVVCVTIQSDGQDEWCELHPLGDVETVDPSLILPAIREAGICGMGGAAFPTHIKLNVPDGKHCDVAIVNGAECETYLTADDRLMREQPERIVAGLRAVMRAIPVDRGVIAIEDNKPEALAAVRAATAAYPNIEVVALKTKYPMGGEKQLVATITGRQIPDGRLPIDIGTVVINVASAAAIADAIIDGKPLISRITTVTGAVVQPSNLRLRIGTSVADAIEACGGSKVPLGKIVLGGGMTGAAAPDDTIPITKASGGIVLMSEEQGDVPDESACIRCGRCVNVCPIRLNPYLLKPLCDTGDLQKAADEHLMKCIVCGCCSYVCPANRRLTATFKDAKDRYIAMKKKEAQK